MKDTRRFFMVGCQRSGTTLLRLILECHSRIFCFDEQKAYHALRDDDCEEAQDAELVGFKIPCWTEQLNDDWLYDAAQGLWCRRFYRGEPIIFVLRDVRDVVTSMMRLRMFGTTWWSACGSLTLTMKLKSRIFQERYARELNLIGDPGLDPYAAAALYWKYKTDAYYDLLEMGWPVYGLRYEDLVANPERELKNTSEFLGLEWERSLLNHFELPHTELDHNGQAMGQTDPNREIDNNSVARWARELSPSDVDRILQVAGELNDRIATAADSGRLLPPDRDALRFIDRRSEDNHTPPTMMDKLDAALDWLAERDRTAVLLKAQLVTQARRANLELSETA